MVSILPNDYRNLVPYFKSKRFYYDSSSTTLLTSEVINSVKTFYEETGVRRSTGVYPSTFRSLRVIEDTKNIFSDIFNIQAENIAFPANSSVAMSYSLSYLLRNKRNQLLMYTNDLSNDILLPIRSYINNNNISAIQLDVNFTLNDWLSSLDLIEGIDEIILVLPAFSLIGEFYNKYDFVRKLQAKFPLKLIIDGTIAGGLNPSNSLFDKADIILFDSNIGWGGPIGQGIMLLKDDFFSIPLTIQGSGTVSNVDFDGFTSLNNVESLETGINPSVIHGLNSSLNFHKQLYSKMFEEISELTKIFRKRISELDELIIPDRIKKDTKTPITSFIIPHLNSHEVAVYLDESFNIDIRSGYFCSHQLIKSITNSYKTDGTLQISFHYYNTLADIDRISEALEKCIKTFFP